MSAASSDTSITARGTKEDYLAILQCLRTFTDDRVKRYREQKDCWYLGNLWEDGIGEITEEKLAKYIENGVLRIGFEGPYGIINGLIFNEIDLFERLADAAPTCSFEGSISAWDSYGDQEVEAKLENGLLYIKATLEGEECEEEDGLWNDEEDYDESNEEKKVYDPVKHEYLNV